MSCRFDEVFDECRDQRPRGSSACSGGEQVEGAVVGEEVDGGRSARRAWARRCRGRGGRRGRTGRGRRPSRSSPECEGRSVSSTPRSRPSRVRPSGCWTGSPRRRRRTTARGSSRTARAASGCRAQRRGVGLGARCGSCPPRIRRTRRRRSTGRWPRRGRWRGSSRSVGPHIPARATSATRMAGLRRDVADRTPRLGRAPCGR